MRIIDYYLSGPMSGLPDYNRDAFNKAAAEIRAKGWTCFNPAENFGGRTDLPREYYMHVDIQGLLYSHAVATLHGWEKSKGAKLEVEIAMETGKEVVPYFNVPTRKAPAVAVGPVSRIALVGWPRAGKDAVGEILVARGYERRAFGDIIKRQVDPLVRGHFGFSAFTEVDSEKAQIRKTLVSWGYDNYRRIWDEFFADVPARCVNTRLFRCVEAREWVERGGVVWEVVSDRSLTPEPEQVAERNEMLDAGLLSLVVENYGTLKDLERTVERHLAEAGLC